MTINFFIFKIDKEKLEKQISYYRKANGIDPKYLIMNENTLNLLKTIAYSSCLLLNKNEDDYGTYWGIPIAVCNKLKDGEVDII